jgi:hypothetical protein
MPNAESVTPESSPPRRRSARGTARARGGSRAAPPAPPAAAGDAVQAAGTPAEQPPAADATPAPAGPALHGSAPQDGDAAAQGGKRDRWLAAARARHQGTGKEPLTPDQLGYLLDLLHQEGQDRRLVFETYGYLDRGMSKGHASVQIKKLRGEFVEPGVMAA